MSACQGCNRTKMGIHTLNPDISQGLPGTCVCVCKICFGPSAAGDQKAALCTFACFCKKPKHSRHQHLYGRFLGVGSGGRGVILYRTWDPTQKILDILYPPVLLGHMAIGIFFCFPLTESSLSGSTVPPEFSSANIK